MEKRRRGKRRESKRGGKHSGEARREKGTVIRQYERMSVCVCVTERGKLQRSVTNRRAREVCKVWNLIHFSGVSREARTCPAAASLHPRSGKLLTTFVVYTKSPNKHFRSSCSDALLIFHCDANGCAVSIADESLRIHGESPIDAIHLWKHV